MRREMQLDSIVAIARREYLARVRTKGFWISTVLLPLFMGAMVFVPTMIASRARATHRMAVVDETGQLGEALAQELAGKKPSSTEKADGKKLVDSRVDREAASFVLEQVPPGEPKAQRAELDRRVLAGEIDSWIRISPEALGASRVEYRAESVSNFITQQRLERALSTVIGRYRIETAGLDADRIADMTRDVELSTVRLSAEGERAEAGIAGFFLAYFLFFLLYMSVAIYGQQVLNGVLEEKTSRVVEVIVAAVRPFDLMLGKLAGIGLVGLTQLAIWLATMVTLTGPGMMTAMAWMPGGKLPEISLAVVGHFLVLFLLGYFFFATLYAAIGAATNNVQEAQQFAGVVIIFLIAPVLLMVPVINDPDSALAVVLSLVPPFTPLLMMLRIAVKMPPVWQIALGYLLTSVFIVFLIWVCARIYRVGILMYGKKPTFQELWRWVRHA